MKKNSARQAVVFIMGPTASGKTQLAIELYTSGKFEIISVDSTMVYQQMDIGSAKPSKQELMQAPHHLIDFIDPAENYSASQFATDAKRLIDETHQANKIPLLVGGTMLYFKALKEGLAELPASDKKIRQQLNDELQNTDIQQLHKQLHAVDPQTADRLHPNDTQRILRALEVFLISGKPLSKWHKEQQLSALNHPLLALAYAPADRAILHERIAQRFQQMMQQGFLQEVEKLFKRGDLNLDKPSIKSVGYRQLWQHLQGKLTLEEATEKAIIATRQLAKRQYTWLRSWSDIQWVDSLDDKQVELAKQKILAACES